MKNKVRIILSIICVICLTFVMDFICIFTINKPLFAIKDKNGYVYRGLFYDVYNCPEYSVPQIKSKGLKLSCAPINIQELKESTYNVTDIENVSISISDISLTGATIIIKDTNRKPYTYGEWYKIEKEVNGKWYEVKTIIENYGFNSIGYLPDKNNEVKFVIDWEWLYGHLPLGSYRILKEVGKQYIGVDFGIATTSDKKIEVIKRELTNLNKFNKYLERDNRVVYLAGNIQEVYYTDLDTRYKLKDYITKTYQTTDDSIKHLTENINLIDILKDGGTTIYKSSEYDITIVKCNTIDGNRNIYIGDYYMNFDNDSMCK